MDLYSGCLCLCWFKWICRSVCFQSCLYIGCYTSVAALYRHFVDIYILEAEVAPDSCVHNHI